METSRRTSTRQRKAAQDSDAAPAEPAAGGSSDEDEAAAVVEGALLAGRKKLSGTTRSARERAELAKVRAGRFFIMTVYSLFLCLSRPPES